MFYRRAIGIEFGLRFLRIGAEGRSAQVTGIDFDDLRLPADASESQRMITRYVEENGLAGIPAVLGVPAEIVFLSLLVPPSGTRQARDAAIRDHLEGLRSLSGSDTVSDVFPLTAHGRTRQMLVGVARHDAVRPLIDSLLTAGVRVVAAIPVSLAFFNLASQKGSRRNTPLVVLCPASDSGLEVLASIGGTLCGVWRLPLTLSNTLDTEAPLLALGAELKAIWRDHSVSNAEVPEVIWCGETPLPDSMKEDLAKIIGREPVALAEWLPETDRAPVRNRLAHALAHSVLRPAKLRLNLLPPAMRDSVARRALLPYWAAAALLFAAFSASLSLDQIRRSTDLREHLQNAQSQWREMQELQACEAELLTRNALRYEQVCALRDSAISPLLTRDLLIAIAQAKHPDDWIIRIADAPSYFAAPSSPIPKEPPHATPVPFTFDPNLIIVEGYTLGVNLSTVRTFIETLRKHPEFVEVDLLGDDLVAPARTYDLLRLIPRIHRFVMKVRIREP